MALLKKALTKLGEECGCADDTAGTQLLSFLVRRNQAEEEEGSEDASVPKSNVMRMVGDDNGELEFDSEEDTDDYSDDQDEFDQDEADINLDVDLDTDEAPDDEDGDAKRLSRLRSLLP